MDSPVEWLIAYLVAINLIALCMTAVDKVSARRGGRRVPERTLLWTAVLGGTPLMLLTMCVIRHKTRHPKFMVGLPILLVAQGVALVWVIKFF